MDNNIYWFYDFTKNVCAHLCLYSYIVNIIYKDKWPNDPCLYCIVGINWVRVNLKKSPYDCSEMPLVAVASKLGFFSSQIEALTWVDLRVGCLNSFFQGRLCCVWVKQQNAISRPSALQLSLHGREKWEVPALPAIKSQSQRMPLHCDTGVSQNGLGCADILSSFLDEHIFPPCWLTSGTTRPSLVTVKKGKNKLLALPPTSTKSDVWLWSPTLTVTDFQPLSFSLWRHSDLEAKTLMLLRFFIACSKSVSQIGWRISDELHKQTN